MKSDWSSSSTGSSILIGDSPIPGLTIPKEIKEVIPHIFKAAKEFGLDFYETIIEWMTYDGLSEVAAYNGFPQRFPHWSHGMSFEELSKGFEFGMHRIFEMVINNRPCVIYCLNSNTFTDNVTVIGHALGHNDFFKNNVFMEMTNRKMMNEFGNNRTRMIELIARWGEQNVEAFIDDCLAIEPLIDPSNAWNKKEYEDPVKVDERTWQFPRRLEVPEGHDHMERWINPKEWINEEWDRINGEERKKELGIIEMCDKDIMKFLLENAPLKPWEQTILSIIYDEAMYFAPNAMTKVLNEGWASICDFQIMARVGMPNCSEWWYADHKSKVLGGIDSENPYKLGFELLLDIEDRWNKGRFGSDYENCNDLQRKENWDLQLGLGREKIFDVRKRYNDITFINEFFTEEFCRKNRYFNWAKFSSNEPGVDKEYRVTDRDWKKTKKFLIQRYLNRGLPDIRLVDPNGKGRGILVLQHICDGRELNPKHSNATLRSIERIWKKPVALLTKNRNKDIIYYCPYEYTVKELDRDEWLKM